MHIAGLIHNIVARANSDFFFYGLGERRLSV
jgi:hypothetical protein